jgi:drug/metabolite transporter (DMT)-like permease
MAGSTAFLWGFLAIAMKVAAVDVPANTIVWFRFTFAFLLLIPLVALRDVGRLKIMAKPPVLGLLAAVALGLNYIGYVGGLERTTPSNAQVLIQLAPLLLAVAGVAVFKERMGRVQQLGVLLAVIGFVVFGYDQYEASGVVREHLLLGNLILVGGAIAWTTYAVFQKMLLIRGFAPQDLNLLLYGLPTLTLWPLADFGVLAGMSSGMWLLMSFLGANTLIAYGALGEAFKRLPAYQVGMIVTLNPLITLATMKVLGVMEVEWAPKDNVGLLGYCAALLVVTGIGVVLFGGRVPKVRS